MKLKHLLFVSLVLLGSFLLYMSLRESCIEKGTTLDPLCSPGDKNCYICK